VERRRPGAAAVADQPQARVECDGAARLLEDGRQVDAVDQLAQWTVLAQATLGRVADEHVVVVLRHRHAARTTVRRPLSTQRIAALDLLAPRSRKPVFRIYLFITSFVRPIRLGCPSIYSPNFTKFAELVEPWL